MTDPDRRRLSAFFRAWHEENDPPSPPYGAVARPDRPPRPAPRRAAFATMLAVVLAAALVVPLLRGRLTRAPDDDEALRFASDLGRWEAPTDFLLATPGSEWLQSSPRFGVGPETLPGDRPILNSEEAFR